MKKFLLLSTFFLLSVLFLLYYFGSSTPRTLSSSVISSSPTPTPTYLPTSPRSTTKTTVLAAAIPQRLQIPSLRIDADVESVGMDAQGNMDIPKDAFHVAWYNLGVKPGQRGNAVMAGHLDTVTGAPAIFARVNTLRKGDEIRVKSSGNEDVVYNVTQTRTYSLQEFPLQEVFGESNEYRLNLITCSGTFNQNANLYSHRTVVYSELVR